MTIRSVPDGDTAWGPDGRAMIAQLNGLEGTTTSSVNTALAGKLGVTLFDAKGDLLVGSTADAVARFAAGSLGQVLTADPNATLGVLWSPGGSLTARNTVTTSYTLALADMGKVIDCNSASAVVVTVPPNSSVAFPLDTVLDVRQLGAGQVTISPGSGVTLNKPASLTTRTQYSRLSIHKINTDTWIVDGDAS